MKGFVAVEYVANRSGTIDAGYIPSRGQGRWKAVFFVFLRALDDDVLCVVAGMFSESATLLLNPRAL